MIKQLKLFFFISLNIFIAICVLLSCEEKNLTQTTVTPPIRIPFGSQFKTNIPPESKISYLFYGSPISGKCSVTSSSHFLKVISVSNKEDTECSVTIECLQTVSNCHGDLTVRMNPSASVSKKTAVNLFDPTVAQVQVGTGGNAFGAVFGDVNRDYEPEQLQLAATIANTNNITMIRTFDQFAPYTDTTTTNWTTFMDTYTNNKTNNNKVLTGIPNQDLETQLGGFDAAKNFVNKYIAPYSKHIIGIAVGNEVPDHWNALGGYINNLYQALQSDTSTKSIPVTLVLGGSELVGWCQVDSGLNGAIQALASLTLQSHPIYLNAYPYDAPPGNLVVSGATIETKTVYGNFRQCFLNFQEDLKNKFGSIVQFDVGVSEVGWSSKGVHSAGQNSCLHGLEANLNCIMNGISNTVGGPNLPIHTFFFELFDEPGKSPEFEKNFGFYTDLDNYPSVLPVLKIGSLHFNDPQSAPCSLEAASLCP